MDFTSRVMAELVGTSFGRALNKALTDGNGSGKPTGVLDGTAGALSGKTTASSTAITKAEIIDLTLSPNHRLSILTVASWRATPPPHSDIQRQEEHQDSILRNQSGLDQGKRGIQREPSLPRRHIV